MKKLSIMLFFITITAFSQNVKKTYNDSFIKKAIREVYQSHENELVYNPTTYREALIKRFFNKLLKIEYLPELKSKEFISTNDLPLMNKYNSNLKRDNTYNPATFNPLKYGIQISPYHTQTYRIANTDYIMTITPSK